MAFSELQHVGGVEPIQLEAGHDKPTPVTKKIETRLTKNAEQTSGSGKINESKTPENDEKNNIARQLLRKLPAEKAYIIYSSLARLKVTQHPTEAILSEVTSRLREDL